MAKKSGKPAGKAPVEIFQFKITLLGTEPPIWRRIQVPDGSLDELHHQIQSCMGWENGHLHSFKIDRQQYGDPGMLDSGWGGPKIIDSLKTQLSDLLARRRKSFRFHYEYDFGDSWLHEIEYEGTMEAEAGGKYPRCLAGERACPPEDVGGVWGYADLVEALGDRKHERYAEMVEWVGRRFKPENFGVQAATKRMGGR